MRALIEALNPFDQFESSAAHSATIMTFKLTALLSWWAGASSLHRDGNVAKYAIVTANPMMRKYLSAIGEWEL